MATKRLKRPRDPIQLGKLIGAAQRPSNLSAISRNDWRTAYRSQAMDTGRTWIAFGARLVG